MNNLQQLAIYLEFTKASIRSHLKSIETVVPLWSVHRTTIAGSNQICSEHNRQPTLRTDEININNINLSLQLTCMLRKRNLRPDDHHYCCVKLDSFLSTEHKVHEHSERFAIHSFWSRFHALAGLCAMSGRGREKNYANCKMLSRNDPNGQ